MTGRSSTLWPPGFIAGVSGILDHPHARVMTPESVAALGFIRRESAFPRRAAAELCQNLPPRRAWGIPGAQSTRSLVCEVGSSKCTRVFTAVAPEITRHPRTQWFYGLLRALPGDRAFLSPSPRGYRHVRPVGLAHLRKT